MNLALETCYFASVLRCWCKY